MPQFPVKELDVIGLALEMKAGLAAHAEVFPTPPVTSVEIKQVLEAVEAAVQTCRTTKSQAEEATLAKLDLLGQLIEKMKKDLRYAEEVAQGDDEKLKLIGWGVKKSPVPTNPPGQARNLVVYNQGEGQVELQWMAPAEGGRPLVYKIQRRVKTAPVWDQIASVFDRTIALRSQPRGQELEYSVIASNRAGDGTVSNTVMVVL